MGPRWPALAPWLCVCFSMGCANHPPARAGAGGDSEILVDAKLTGKTPLPERDAPGVQPSSAELPVDSDDGVWGEASAPVTLLVFTDLECPYCSQAHQILTVLERHYGEKQLRVVIKHLPLARHAGAVPAARVAQAVLALGGRRMFFEFLDRAFAAQEQVALGRALEIAAPLRLDPEKLRAKAESAAIGAEILRDVNLADRVGVPATPHFRVNGLGLTGAQPAELLRRMIDAERVEVARLQQSGVPVDAIYARRVTANLARPEPEL